jgi:hypothetical protein
MADWPLVFTTVAKSWTCFSSSEILLVGHFSRLKNRNNITTNRLLLVLLNPGSLLQSISKRVHLSHEAFSDPMQRTWSFEISHAGQRPVKCCLGRLTFDCLQLVHTTRFGLVECMDCWSCPILNPSSAIAKSPV